MHLFTCWALYPPLTILFLNYIISVISQPSFFYSVAYFALSKNSVCLSVGFFLHISSLPFLPVYSLVCVPFPVHLHRTLPGSFSWLSIFLHYSTTVCLLPSPFPCLSPYCDLVNLPTCFSPFHYISLLLTYKAVYFSFCILSYPTSHPITLRPTHYSPFIIPSCLSISLSFCHYCTTLPYLGFVDYITLPSIFLVPRSVFLRLPA